MSSWGNLDNVILSGNVVTSDASNTVTGYGGASFNTEVDAGDYITIESQKYQIEQVVSDSILYLTSIASANTDNVKAFVQQGPKYVSNIAVSENVYTIQRIYGIDRNEVGVPENKTRGISQPGWVHYNTYTDALGQTRHKAETLVAMSKNFASNITGSLFADTGSADANDDTVAADYLLYFTTQPEDSSNTAGNGVVLLTVAASEPTGATLTYQWYVRENTDNLTYVILADTDGITGNTTNTLTIDNVSNVDGNVFRLTISASGTGADDNTSAEAEVTAS